MPTLVGFGTFAALPEEQISEKISRRVLSGDQGMIVWWSMGAGVHVEPHSHANEQIVWMLKGKMEFRLGNEQRVCGRGRRRGHPGRYRARGMVPGRHRGDRLLRAPARRLPTRRQTRLHERRLNRSLRLLTDRAHVQFAPRRAPAMGARVILESKHPCRLGGDRSLPASSSRRSQRDLELIV